jgi:hypothetical protein
MDLLRSVIFPLVKKPPHVAELQYASYQDSLMLVAILMALLAALLAWALFSYVVPRLLKISDVQDVFVRSRPWFLLAGLLPLLVFIAITVVGVRLHLERLLDEAHLSLAVEWPLVLIPALMAALLAFLGFVFFSFLLYTPPSFPLPFPRLRELTIRMKG